jgi:4-hydroxybenzoate polyprenyltransferase
VAKMIMNETGNVYGAVLLEYSNFFIKINRFGTFIKNEFVYGHHWCSLNASAIALSMMILLGINIRWEFVLIAYLGTQCIYNYNHYKEIDVDSVETSPRVDHIRKYGDVYPLIIKIYGVLYFVFLVIYGNILSILFGIFLLSIGLFYTTNVKNASKKIIGFKSLYTSISWGLLILFTAIYCSYPLTIGVLLFFAFVFIRMMIITTFYDIKDISSDQESGLTTLPMIFKSKNSWLNILHGLNIISLIPIFLGIIFNILPINSLILLPLLFYGFTYIQKAKRNTADINFLSYILADGDYNIWPVLLILGVLIPFV